jgi:hypothetical protein
MQCNAAYHKLQLHQLIAAWWLRSKTEQQLVSALLMKRASPHCNTSCKHADRCTPASCRAAQLTLPSAHQAMLVLSCFKVKVIPDCSPCRTTCLHACSAVLVHQKCKYTKCTAAWWLRRQTKQLSVLALLLSAVCLAHASPPLQTPLRVTMHTPQFCRTPQLTISSAHHTVLVLSCFVVFPRLVLLV